MRQPPQNTAHLSKAVANTRLLIILRAVLRGKGKTKKKGKSSATTQAMLPQTKKREQEKWAMLDRKEMKELSARIFNAKQANDVKEQIRLTLMKDSRVNYQSDRKSFAEHLLAVPQKQQFNFCMAAGFCRKLSTLARNPLRVL